MRRQRRRGMEQMRREGKGKGEEGARRWGMGNNIMPPGNNPHSDFCWDCRAVGLYGYWALELYRL